MNGQPTSDRYWWLDVFKYVQLPGPVKGVGRAIADESMRSTGVVEKVDIDDLALFSGHSERTVQRALPVLEAEGFFHVVPSPRKGITKTYQLTIPEGLPAERPKTDCFGVIQAWLAAKGVSVAPKKGVSVTPEDESAGRQSDTPSIVSGVRESGSGVTVTPPPVLQEELPKSSAADAAASAESSKKKTRKPNGNDPVWAQLQQALALLLDSPDYDGRALTAYLEVLETIEDLDPKGLATLTPSGQGDLRNRLVAHALANFLDYLEIGWIGEYQERVAPLTARAKQLGTAGGIGHRHVLKAIAYSVGRVSADSYLRYINTVATETKKESLS